MLAPFCSASPLWLEAVNQPKPAAAKSHHGEPPQELLTFETWSDDGALVLGDVRLEDKILVLCVNSRQRSDRGCALLSDIGGRVGQP